MIKLTLQVLGAVMAALVLFLIGLSSLSRLLHELSIRGHVARIEQLREDVIRTQAGSNEDVIGQVTHWNQEIRAAKAYRQVWWGRLCIPVEWEYVNIIVIPRD